MGGDDGWRLDPALSLSAALALEAARRAIPRLHRHDLEAQLDQALIAMTQHDHLLRQVLARVIELETQLALVGQSDRHRHWAAELMQELAEHRG